jgi:hypothetical protein
VEDVAEGIRVLQTRDGVKITEEQVLDRARNIVAGLIGNYRFESMDAAAARREAPASSSSRGARTVDQLNLLDKVRRGAPRPPRSRVAPRRPSRPERVGRRRSSRRTT